MPNAAANTEAYPIVTALVAPPGAPVIDTVVNLPVEAVVAPTLILSILPVTPEPIVNTPLPVGLIVMLALFGLKFTIPLADKVVNANNQIFKTLEKSLNDFVNKTDWTGQVMKQNEKINCSIYINLTAGSSDQFSGTIQVQSSRPIFDSTYSSPVFNFNDKDFNYELF